MLVHFFELSGPDAQDQLVVFSKQIQSPHLGSVELLESLEQANLFLLVVKSTQKLTLIPPHGTRVWSFKSTF